MGLLDTFRLNQAITTVLAIPRGDLSVAAAAIQIREMGAGAVPRLVQNLARDQHGTLSELLGEVVTNATLKMVNGGTFFLTFFIINRINFF